MKAFLIGIIFIVLAVVGGYFYLKNSSGTAVSPTTSYQTSSITRTGMLQKSNGMDYRHVIISGGQTWGVTSQSINLDQYIGKQVEATGQNSGTTLYIDNIVVIQ